MEDNHETDRLESVTRAFSAQRDELLGLHELIDVLQRLMARVRATGISAADVTLIHSLLRTVCAGCGADAGAVLASDDDSGELVFVAVQGPDPETLLWERLDGKSGLAGWVAKQRRAAIVNSPRTDERFLDRVDGRVAAETHSVLAVPVEAAGRFLGVIEVLNKREDRLFTRRDEALAELASHHLGLFLAKLASEGSPAASIAGSTTGASG